MRPALINENADLANQNHRYVMRITGSDAEGQAELDNFIDSESTYPVLVTTSRLLSTGVDVQACRLIVLDREVGSMTEFKQIVGRGARVHEDSRRIREEFENGRHYHDLHRPPVDAPANLIERPDPVALTWHDERCSRAEAGAPCPATDLLAERVDKTWILSTCSAIMSMASTSPVNVSTEQRSRAT